MKFLKYSSFALLFFFVISLSVGVSLGDQDTQEILILDYKSGETKKFQDLLLTRANIIILTETTCYSCIKELQAMEIIRAKYRGDVAVIADFIDRQGLAKVERYLEYYNFDLDMLLVDESSALPRKYQVNYIPTMIIFDQDGNLMFRKEGFQEGDESLISKKIEEIIHTDSARAQAGTDTDSAAKGSSTGKASSKEEPTKAAPAPEQVKKTSGCASSPG